MGFLDVLRGMPGPVVRPSRQGQGLVAECPPTMALLALLAFKAWKMLWGGGEDIASIVADVNRWSALCRS
jgi:hypothetical protein